MVQLLPLNHLTATVSGCPRVGWGSWQGQAWGLVCAMPPIPDSSWVLLQMIRPGLGPPNPPLSGSSCPSTKLRSAAGRRRVADPRPRQPLVPTGGGTPSPGVCRPPCFQQGCWALFLVVLTCCVGVSVLSLPCLFSGTCLSLGQVLALGELGPRLFALPPSLPLSPLTRLLPPVPPLSVPDPWGHTPTIFSSALKHAGSSPGNLQAPCAPS